MITSDAAAMALASGKLRRMSSQPKGVILNVDDNDFSRRAVSRILEKDGFRVLEAATGEDALRLVQENPDLVLLDVNLPDVSGYEVCRRIKADPAGFFIPVVHLSATMVTSRDWATGLENGADGYLTHPVDRVVLLGTVNSLLRARRAEAEARQAGLQWQTTFDAIGEGICLLDEQGRVRRFNSALPELVGRPPEEILNRPWQEMMQGAVVPAFAPLFSRSAPQGRATAEFQLRDRWIRVLLDPVVQDGGACQGSVLAVADVSEQRRLEQQLLRAQRLEMAGRMAAQVAHDFNNLLGPLVAYPELIKMKLPEAHPAVAFCDAMMQAAQQMADINGDMMTLSRRGLLERKPVDLNRVVEEAVGQLVGCRDGLTMRLDLAPDLLPASGSPAQLLRVVANLVSNAREAMDDIGLLTLETRNVYIGHPLGHYNRVEPGEYVRLEVSDTGPGIPPEIVGRVFDAFFTTRTSARRRGSGLGLSIVQAIVEDHRGQVDLRTEMGKGTTFSVYLPIHRGPSCSTQKAGLYGGTEEVLVVDDDPGQRQVVGELLQNLGYAVQGVSSGEEAIAYLSLHAVDLLILDMVMPTGMDGAETYRLARDVRPGQKAILLSGYAESDRVWEAQSLGAGPYVRKPVTLGELARAVRNELERSG